MIGNIPWWAGLYLLAMAAMAYFEFVGMNEVDSDDPTALTGFDLYGRIAMYLGGVALVISYFQVVAAEWAVYALLGTAAVVAGTSLYFMSLELKTLYDKPDGSTLSDDDEPVGLGFTILGYSISNFVHVGGIVFAVLVALRLLQSA